MANMSYCRFENTNRDLNDVQGALDDLLAGAAEDGPLSDDERWAAIRLVKTCQEIVNSVKSFAQRGDDTLDLTDEEIESCIDAAQEEAAENVESEDDAEDEDE